MKTLMLVCFQARVPVWVRGQESTPRCRRRPASIGQWAGRWRSWCSCTPRVGAADLLSLWGCQCLHTMKEGRKEMFNLIMHSTHFIYSYIVKDTQIVVKDTQIVVKDTPIVIKETHCFHYMSYYFQLAASVLLHAPSHTQDSTYHSLCYTCRGALAGMRNSSMGPP